MTPFLGTIRDKKPSVFFAKTNCRKSSGDEVSITEARVYHFFAKIYEGLFVGSNPTAPTIFSSRLVA
jgi:hypothetical protein